MSATPSLPPASHVTAIIVSAGSSTRMAGVDKMRVDLAGEPLIARTVEAFEASPRVGTVVLMVSAEALDGLQELVAKRGWAKVTSVRRGGRRRQDTVRLGLKALPSDCRWVVVHDGARPFVTPTLIEAGLAAAQASGAAIAAVPVKDTVKVVTDGIVRETLDRAKLVQVQTPQVFRRDLLERAHREVTEDVTDDAAMMERVGVTVRLFSGDYGNIKVTTPEDLAAAEALLGARERETSEDAAAPLT